MRLSTCAVPVALAALLVACGGGDEAERNEPAKASAGGVLLEGAVRSPPTTTRSPRQASPTSRRC